ARVPARTARMRRWGQWWLRRAWYVLLVAAISYGRLWLVLVYVVYPGGCPAPSRFMPRPGGTGQFVLRWCQPRPQPARHLSIGVRLPAFYLGWLGAGLPRGDVLTFQRGTSDTCAKC